MTYSCDLSWDAWLAAFWGINTILAIAAAAMVGPTGSAIGGIITSMAMTGLFIATAVISGKIRKAAGSENAAAACDIEAVGATHIGLTGTRPQGATTKPPVKVVM